MIIIIGLGNPGKKFEHTRHNVGFMALDFFAKKNEFPEFEMSKKYDSLISEKDSIILLKPQTFMNNSGLAARKATRDRRQETSLIVIHDDIDLPIGTLKVVENRGSAGHKGVESIIQAVGNENLVRFRVGIQPLKGKPKNSESWVIKKFTKDEEVLLTPVIEKTAEALDFFIQHGLERTMNEYN